jgi:hypothetical protein
MAKRQSLREGRGGGVRGIVEAVYKVRFLAEGRIFELYARNVTSSSLFGFIEVEKLVWGKRSEVIVDPTEQELKNEFAGVKRTLLPIHAIVRIDEVEKTGAAKILPLPAGAASRQTVPVPLYSKSGPTSE